MWFVFFQQKQIQIFRQQIQRREYHISRIIETKYPEFSLPEDKLKVLVTKWEIVKQKVTVLEERIWEVGRHVRKDGTLGNLLLWLHEAEALLNYYETDESWVCEVPAKFLLRQHEVSVGFCSKNIFFSFGQRFRLYSNTVLVVGYLLFVKDALIIFCDYQVILKSHKIIVSRAE